MVWKHREKLAHYKQWCLILSRNLVEEGSPEQARHALPSGPVGFAGCEVSVGAQQKWPR